MGRKKNNIWCVYIHISRSTGKCYIGRSKNVNVRWSYDGGYYQNCSHFFNAIQKYGFDDFYHLIIEHGLSEEESICLEREYIQKYKASNPKYGYNISSDSDKYSAKTNEIIDKQKSVSSRKNRDMAELSRKVRCINTGDIYDSIYSASEELNIERYKILKNCRGEIHTLQGGMRFKFCDKGCIDLKKK